MTTMTPMFKTSKNSASAVLVIVALCASLAAGFIATASKKTSGPEFRAATTVSSVTHAS